jgi:hypothetical protein
MSWFRRRRPCAECVPGEHPFCMRKRWLGVPCRCTDCWSGDITLPAEMEWVRQPSPMPEFLLLGWRQDVPVFTAGGDPRSRKGTLVFQSVTLTDATFQRRLLPGYDRGPLGAKLPRYEIKVTVTMADFTQHWGSSFPAVMRELGWRRAP